MAEYQITRWNTETITKLGEATRRTRTSAANLAYRYAYESLKAFAKLDTKAAHAVRDAMVKWDDLLPIGDQRVIEISNTGHSVVMVRIS
jgi:hypothetical protein